MSAALHDPGTNWGVECVAGLELSSDNTAQDEV